MSMSQMKKTVSAIYWCQQYGNTVWLYKKKISCQHAKTTAQDLFSNFSHAIEIILLSHSLLNQHHRYLDSYKPVKPKFVAINVTLKISSIYTKQIYHCASLFCFLLIFKSLCGIKDEYLGVRNTYVQCVVGSMHDSSLQTELKSFTLVGLVNILSIHLLQTNEAGLFMYLHWTKCTHMLNYCILYYGCASVGWHAIEGIPALQTVYDCTNMTVQEFLTLQQTNHKSWCK